MSLILDALNKSDRERPDQAPVPGLQSAHGPLGVQSLPWWRRYWLPQLAALCVVVGIAAVLFAPPEAAHQSLGAAAPAGTGAASTAAPAVALAPVVATGPAPNVPANSRIASQRSDVAAQGPAQIARTDVDQAPASAPMPEPGRTEPGSLTITGSGGTARSPDARQTGVAELYASRSAVTAAPMPVKTQATLPPKPAAQANVVTLPGRSFSQAIEAADIPVAGGGVASAANATPAQAALDVDRIARIAEAELEAPPYEESPVPLVMELSQSERDRIPTVFYSAHDWSSNAAQSVVTLNGQTRREGDRIKPGLTLETILESSIVLNYEGTQFRLRSLNSWVNL